MEYYSPDIPGLSTGSLVMVLIEEDPPGPDVLIIRRRFSQNTKDERSLTWKQATSLHEATQYVLERPRDGWDIELKEHSSKALTIRFDRETDHSRPGGPGIVRFEVKGVRFLFNHHNCQRFQEFLKEAMDLMTVSEVMES